MRHNAAHRHTWRVAWALVLTVALLCGLWPVRGWATDAAPAEDVATELATDGAMAPEVPQNDSEAADTRETPDVAPEVVQDNEALEEANPSTEQTSLPVDGVDGVTITGELPVGASAEAQDVSANVEGALDGMDVLAAFDITLYDAQDEACEPDAPVRVTVEDVRIAETLDAGGEVLVYYVPDDPSEDPEPMTVVVAEGTTVTFEAPHFSTYVMVTPTEPTTDPVTEPATELDGRGLTMSVSGRYITTAAVTGNPAGLGKTTDAQKAPTFYFEAAGDPSDGTYYISVMVDGQTKYLDFSKYSNDSAALQLVDEKSQVFTVTYDSSDGKYVIGGEDGGNTYYFSQFNGNKGNRFAGWKSVDDNCKFVFGEKRVDPLGLNGGEYVIVNIQNVALLTEAYGTTGLKGTAVTQTTEDGSTLFVAGDGTNLPLWLFEAQDDGTYYISTVVGGEKRYLNISTFNPAANRSASLSATPQRISVEYYSGAIRFVNPDDPIGGALDLYNKGSATQQFSVWNIANNNEKFYLGQPYAQTVIYKYPKASEDHYDPQNLPSYTMDSWETGATTYTVGEPSQDPYYSIDEDANKRYTFTFQHWVDDEGNVYSPGNTINVTDVTETITLSAVWELTNTEDIPIVVSYVIEQQNQQQSNSSANNQTLVGSLPTTVGNVTSEEKSGIYAEHYTVLNLETTYYQTKSNDRKKIYTYEFVGWETESGALITAEAVAGQSTVIDLLQGRDANGSPYDLDGDGTVTLTAKWTSYYVNPSSSGNKVRSVYFYVLKNASADDLFADRVLISTNPSDFTTTPVYGTTMHPTDTAPSPSSGDWYVIVDQQWDDWGVLKADQAIRSLGGSGYAFDGTTFTTLTFPADEEVFAAMQANGESLTVDGQTIPAEDLTPENYTIRWYVAKYQADGWHIDGKLTARVHYATISKTFQGDEDAVAAALEGAYNITLGTAEGTTDEKAPYKLVLTDKTGRTVEDGYLGTEGDYTKYGYVRRSGNTFTWVVRVAGEGVYEVTEHDYAVTVGDETYGVSAQYSVTNAGGDDVALTQWASDIYATSEKHAKDETDPSSFRATNIFNTYVPTGTFVIQKRDSDAASTPMPGVQFAVYAVEGGVAGQQMKLSKAEGSTATDGTYTVLYENGTVSDVAHTGADGNIYLTLPKPDTGTYTFEVRETVPQGYLGYGTETPRFHVTVDPDGGYTVDVIDAGRSSIEQTTIGTPGSPGGVVSGASVINRPQTVDVKATKTWKCNPESSVTMTLTGTAGGTTRTYTAVLNAGNNWTYTWKSLPLMRGGEYVDYSVQETKINNYEIGSDAFSHWIPQYVRPVYKDANGQQLDYAIDFSTEVAEADKYKVAEIAYEVRNVEQETDVVTVVLHKTDMTDPTKDLNGAKFQICEAKADGAIDLTYGNETVKVEDNGYVATFDGMDLKFHNNRDYYLREIDPPAGYEVIEGLIKISVSADGRVTLGTESGKEVSDEGRVTLAQEGLTVMLTVVDDPTPTTLKVTKEVTGAYGDKTKRFGFTITLPAGVESLTGTVERRDGTSESVTFTSSSCAFALADGESLLVEGIDVGKQVTVTEDSAEGYTPEVVATLDEGTEGTKSTTGNSATVCMTTGGGSATAAFTNTCEAVPPTGILSDVGPWVLLMGLVAGALGMLSVRRKKSLG